MRNRYDRWDRFVLHLRDKYPLLLVGTFVALLFLTGIGVGLAVEDAEASSIPDIAYRMLMVLLFESGNGVDGSTGWSLLGICRILAPVASVLFSIVGLYFIFTAAADSYMLRFRSGHTVLFGLGSNGREYLACRQGSDERCVVVLDSPTPEDVKFLKERDISLYKGAFSSLEGEDARFVDHMLYHRLGIHKAGLVLALSSDDGRNIRNMTRVVEIAKEKNRKPGVAKDGNGEPPLSREKSPAFRIGCGINDLGVYTQLLENGLLAEQGIELVNLDILCAQDAIRTIHPLSGLLSDPSGFRPMHLVILGFGALGQALLKVAAEEAACSDKEPLKVLVVDKNATELLGSMMGQFPGIRNVAKIVTCDADILSESGLKAIKEVGSNPAVRPVLVMTIHDTTQATSILLQLASRDLGKDARIFVRDTTRFANAGWLLSKHLARFEELASLPIPVEEKELKKYDEKMGPWEPMRKVKLYGKAIDLYDPDNLTGTRIWDNAKKFHRDYKLAEFKAMNPDDTTSIPEIQPWDDLLPTLRYSNRCAARHIDHKLDALGLVGPIETVDATLLDEAIEQHGSSDDALARLEHARWNAERFTNGWTLADGKCIARKESPYLVPWDMLVDDKEWVKEYDRISIATLRSMAKPDALES